MLGDNLGEIFLVPISERPVSFCLGVGEDSCLDYILIRACLSRQIPVLSVDLLIHLKTRIHGQA